jgi:hypothetical protein
LIGLAVHAEMPPACRYSVKISSTSNYYLIEANTDDFAG